jgi:hypothetical protein
MPLTVVAGKIKRRITDTRESKAKEMYALWSRVNRNGSRQPPTDSATVLACKGKTRTIPCVWSSVNSHGFLKPNPCQATADRCVALRLVRPVQCLLSIVSGPKSGEELYRNQR